MDKIKKERKISISDQTKNLEKFRRMATVIQDSNDAITFQDLDGNILAWNRGAEIMYGYSEAEALTKNIVDTVPKEYQEEALEFIKALKRGELVPTLETKRKSKNGQIIDVWLTNTKLTDDNGKLTGIATTERNITERKQSEESLREKFRELDYLREGQIALSERMRGEQVISRLGQSILNHLVPFTDSQIGAFYLVTDDKHLELVSSYALPDVATTPVKIAFGEGLIGQVALEKRSLLIENVPSAYFSKIKSALGETVPRSLLICPILYEGQVTGVVELGSLHQHTEHQRAFLSHVSENIGIAINTTDVRKKVQDLLEKLEIATVTSEQAKDVAEKANDFKSAFLANISHEIRTPLAAILGFAELLRNPQLTSDKRKEFLDIIYRNGESLSVIINDVLDLSKVEAGHLNLELTPTDPRQVVEDVVALLAETAAKKGLSLECTFDYGTPVSVVSDPTRLRQVLLNLVGNAIKFTNAGSVKVHVFSDFSDAANSKVCFKVTDTGIGIKSTERENIFEMFAQADETVTRRFGGTGLGLALARNLARALGGDIWLAESTIGKGSTFLFKLVDHAKAVGPDFAVVAARSKAAIPHSNEILSGLKVLIIDDTPDNRTLFSNYLANYGATSEIAINGAHGIRKALDGDFDIVLMDIQMPEMDGYTASRHLRTAGYQKPIVALTAHALVQIREKCLAAGYNDHLTKPVTAFELIETILKWTKPLTMPPANPKEFKVTEEMIQIYLERRALDLNLLKLALKENSVEDFNRIGHQITGNAKSYGFESLVPLAVKMENLLPRELATSGPKLTEEFSQWLNSARV